MMTISAEMATKKNIQKQLRRWDACFAFATTLVASKIAPIAFFSFTSKFFWFFSWIFQNAIARAARLLASDLDSLRQILCVCITQVCRFRAIIDVSIKNVIKNRLLTISYCQYPVSFLRALKGTWVDHCHLCTEALHQCYQRCQHLNCRNYWVNGICLKCYRTHHRLRKCFCNADSWP